MFGLHPPRIRSLTRVWSSCLHRVSQALQIRSIWVYLVSQALASLLHPASEAQRLMQATNHEILLGFVTMALAFQFAVVAQSLGAGAVLVNPWNTTEVADTICQALKMSSDEREK